MTSYLSFVEWVNRKYIEEYGQQCRHDPTKFTCVVCSLEWLEQREAQGAGGS